MIHSIWVAQCPNPNLIQVSFFGPSSTQIAKNATQICPKSGWDRVGLG